MPALRNHKQPTGKVDWETPKELITALEREFLYPWPNNVFRLDPCAGPLNKQATYWFGPENEYHPDGLVEEWWAPTVYVNPPYGRGIGKWVQKCFEEVDKGHAHLVVALLPVAVGTRWWRDWCSTATEIRFLKGRVTFVGAPAPSAFESAVAVWHVGQLSWHRVSYWDWREGK